MKFDLQKTMENDPPTSHNYSPLKKHESTFKMPIGFGFDRLLQVLVVVRWLAF